MANLQQDNFNDALPAPPAGAFNVKWQADPEGTNPRNISAYVAGGSGLTVSVYEVALTPSGPGNFTVPHGAPVTPTAVLVTMKSGGEIWLQKPLSFDATTLYLVASDMGIVGTATVFTSGPDVIQAVAPGAPGNFTVAHGLSYTPALVLIEMTSGGEIWFQTPGWDGTNLYLTASDASITGNALIWKTVPNLVLSAYVKVSLMPSAPGNFTVAHTLGKSPGVVVIRMTSSGAIWLQTPTGYDASNLYLVASDMGITGEAELWTA